MAMRLYTIEELEEDLKNRWGLTKIEEDKEIGCIVWKTTTDHFITSPLHSDGEDYPDFILDDIIEQINALEKSMI